MGKKPGSHKAWRKKASQKARRERRGHEDDDETSTSSSTPPQSVSRLKRSLKRALEHYSWLLIIVS